MNLFRSYLIKYAYGCDAVGFLNSSELLQKKLEAIMSDMEKPELEHAAPVDDKVVEITVVKTSTNDKLIKTLLSYGLKFAPKMMPLYNELDPKDLADIKIDVGYSLPQNKDTKVDDVEQDSTQQLNGDKTLYPTTSDLFNFNNISKDTALA